jgi:hypothetical protein
MTYFLLMSSKAFLDWRAVELAKAEFAGISIGEIGEVG